MFMDNTGEKLFRHIEDAFRGILLHQLLGQHSALISTVASKHLPVF
jgi:hypothetical protein